MIYEVYAKEYDMTFIIEEDDNTVEVKGFYFGEPNADDTELFYGKLKAEIEP